MFPVSGVFWYCLGIGKFGVNCGQVPVVEERKDLCLLFALAGESPYIDQRLQGHAGPKSGANLPISLDR